MGAMLNLMKTFLQKLEPKDILAAVVLIGGFVLLALGVDTVVGGVIIAVVAYYFRKRVEDIKPEKKDENNTV